MSRTRHREMVAGEMCSEPSRELGMSMRRRAFGFVSSFLGQTNSRCNLLYPIWQKYFYKPALSVKRILFFFFLLCLIRRCLLVWSCITVCFLMAHTGISLSPFTPFELVLLFSKCSSFFQSSSELISSQKLFTLHTHEEKFIQCGHREACG